MCVDRGSTPPKKGWLSQLNWLGAGAPLRVWDVFFNSKRVEWRDKEYSGATEADREWLTSGEGWRTSYYCWRSGWMCLASFLALWMYLQALLVHGFLTWINLVAFVCRDFLYCFRSFILLLASLGAVFIASNPSSLSSPRTTYIT